MVLLLLLCYISHPTVSTQTIRCHHFLHRTPTPFQAQKTNHSLYAIKLSLAGSFCYRAKICLFCAPCCCGCPVGRPWDFSLMLAHLPQKPLNTLWHGCLPFHQFTVCPQANNFICSLASLFIKLEYRHPFASQEHLEQKELMFVRFQIARLGKEDEKMQNCMFPVSIRQHLKNMSWYYLLNIRRQFS